MKITLAKGMHYCYDCNDLILDDEHESVWFCDKCAKRRGANIIDGKPYIISKCCHSSNDGECNWEHCPQLRDGEPEKSGRSCPLHWLEDDDL